MPDGGHVVWRTAQDGVRLRFGWWGEDGAKGTVLLFPGRTEYLEKYGKLIPNLTEAGFAVVSVDWRGQGLSDRLDKDERLGHVPKFTDYQLDVGEMVALAHEVGLPSPWFLIAHSMGGCIGLRALVSGLPVERAVFSAPMWGIEMPAYARPLAYLIPPIARILKQETSFAPGTKPSNYVTDTAFDENMLTTDRETFDWLAEHAMAEPEFALGGPSVQWVGSATQENDALHALPRPKIPVLTFVGSREEIVSVPSIRKLHADWPSARLRVVEGAKHEIMMERKPLRDRFLQETLAFFTAG